MKKFMLLLVMSTAFYSYSQTIPMMSVKSVEFKPATFTPSQYKPVDNSSSMSILQQSMQRREQRQYAASDKYMNFCKMLGDISLKLYPDNDLQKWYHDYKENILADITNNYQAGNYQITMQLIDERMKHVTNDPLLLSRIEASQRYDSFKRNELSKFIGSVIYEWWLDTHTFFYEDCFDESNQFIGYKSTNLEMPLADFGWIDHILYVRDNLLTGRKFTHDTGGNLFDNFAKQSPEFVKSVEQSYNVAVWYYNRELSRNTNSDSAWMASQKELLFEGGKQITPREYYIRKLSDWLIRK